VNRHDPGGGKRPCGCRLADRQCHRFDVGQNVPRRAAHPAAGCHAGFGTRQLARADVDTRESRGRDRLGAEQEPGEGSERRPHPRVQIVDRGLRPGDGPHDLRPQAQISTLQRIGDVGLVPALKKPRRIV